jgi:vacuolar-type H+-ATPase subunit C/Vma6
VIRFAYAPEERKFLKDWLGSDDISRLFVGPGKLSFDLLAGAGGQETVDAAVEILDGTVYEDPMRDSLDAYAATGRLSVFENQFNRFRLDWSSSLISKDPLGIGVLLGYQALKTTEVSNIRWIAHGISLGMPANTIRSELMDAI